MTDAKKAADQETRARRIIDRLKMFNRKERDHLMKFALCEKPEAPRISEALWKKISNGGTRPTNPDAMFVGMDYHLNWLHAALATAGEDDSKLENHRSNEWEMGEKLDDQGKKIRPIQKNQEDIDLLVAWIDSDSEKLKLVLIEAKLDSGWGSAQIKSKRKRLTLMREDAEMRAPKSIEWKFLLMSPGSCPTKNEFGSGKFKAPDDWFLSERDKDGKPTLWYEHLPLARDLVRVKRVNEKGVEWTTVSSTPADSN